MNIKNCTATLLCLLAVELAAQGIFSSVEQFNFQTDSNTTILRNYEGFDELSDFPGVTGYSVSVNGGTPESIPSNPEFDGDFKRRLSYDTLPEMLAARPVDGTYLHSLSGTPETDVLITAPGFDFANAVPVNPLFTFEGVSGSWSLDEQGMGVFSFDPNSVSSFTLTMNLYSSSTLGDAFLGAISVANINNGFNAIDNVSSDIQLNGDAPLQLSVSFTEGLPLDGGDSDPSTFGFSEGSAFEIEGEFVNVFLQDSFGLDDETLAAFIYQNVTGLKIQATSVVPEPATVSGLFGIAALAMVIGRRRKVRTA